MGVVDWVYAGVLGVLGLAVGSFLNVVAYRTPNGISILTPPSACPRCGSRIAAYDNLPIVGYLALGGKCRNCRERIPIRYLLAEAATGALWAATGWKIAQLELGYWTNIAVGLIWLAFVSAAVVTFIVDYDFLIILDEISIGGCVLALALSPIVPYLHHAHDKADFSTYHMILAGMMPDAPAWQWSLVSSVLGAAVGFGFSVLILYMGNAAFQKQIEAARKHDPDVKTALGWGDVKLMAFYGAFQGWLAVFLIFIIASVLGAIIGAAVKLRTGDPSGLRGIEGLKSRWRTSSSVIPFGPFLVAASLVYFFLEPQIFHTLYG